MGIHREGFKPLLIVFLLLLGMGVLLSYLGVDPLIRQLVAVASGIFFLLVLQFFRNPKVIAPVNEKHVLAPADGKVVVIEDVEEEEYFHDTRTQISIFMSPLNVHVNRNPISGLIEYFRYHPGKYLVAWHPKSSTENERTTVVVKTPNNLEVLFRQIAGAVARRIKYYIKEGDNVEQGAEFGFIKFGSRVDILIPKDSRVVVKVGEKTKAGKTVLAEIG